jgi:hypothetical protein
MITDSIFFPRRIQRRKKTESIILAIVIAACAITVIYFSILR